MAGREEFELWVGGGGGPQDYRDSPSPILTLNNWDFLVFDSNGLDLGLGNWTWACQFESQKRVYNSIYRHEGWLRNDLGCDEFFMFYIHGQQLLSLKWIRLHLNLEIKSNKGLTFIYKLQ